jgi:FkbM family methyltransferase
MGIATYEIADLTVKLIDSDDRIVFHKQHPEHSGSYEPDSLALWASLIKPGMVVLDVGAYTGLYAIIAALRGAMAIAIEPMPANHWRIGVNAKLNKVKVDAIAAAASDRDGRATLHYNPKVSLTTGASLQRQERLHRDQIEVKCLTIDSLMLANVSAIKIDVEWHEPCVIRGAMRTIEKWRPALLIETLDDDMRQQVSDMLPGYRKAMIYDARNSFFAPK